MGKTKTQFIGDTLTEEKSKKKEKVEKVHLSGLKGGQRVKLVGETEVHQSAPSVVANKDNVSKAKKAVKFRGKRYLEAKSKVSLGKIYSIKDAVLLVKETSTSSFTGTVEMHLVIKKEGFSTSVSLPYSSGKVKKIEVADDKTIEKLKTGKIDFDVLLATYDMMPKLVPFAKLLGPKGLMPNPKNGTIIKSVKDADKFNASKINIKTEKKSPVIHTSVGKVDMKEEEIAKNIEAVLDAVGRKQIVKAYLAPTMGPSVKIEVV